MNYRTFTALRRMMGNINRNDTRQSSDGRQKYQKTFPVPGFPSVPGFSIGVISRPEVIELGLWIAFFAGELVVIRVITR